MKRTVSPIVVVGLAGVISWFLFKDQLKTTFGFSADEEGNETFSFANVVEAIQGRFAPSDLEQQKVERTGMNVDIIPQNLSDAVRDEDYACQMAFDKSMRLVNDAPGGPGVSDFKIQTKSPYDYELSAEDFRADGLGQEGVPSAFKVMDQGYSPRATVPCCKPIDSFGMDLSLLDSVIGPAQPTAGRAALSMLQGETSFGIYNPEVNDSYTNGNMTQTLAAWSSEGWVERVNEAEVRFIPHMGGSESMLRRV